jgi:DNA-binding transcriptional LysR family regulator
VTSVFRDSDLKLLRVFRAIVESGGFSAAQVTLNSSASRISTQMADLEARLGVRLCHRGRSGFALTDEGRAVYEESEKVFLAIDDFRLRVSETQTRLAGDVRLGLIDNLSTNPASRVPQAIARFKQRDNDVSFDLKIEPSLELEAGVLDGRLHLAVGYFHHRVSALDYRPLLSEVHHLYCGRDHPLFRRRDSGISADELLVFDYANRRYFESEGELASEFGTRGSAASDNMEALTVLILSGVYLAFLPDDHAHLWVERGDIRPILPDRISQEATLHLLTRKGVERPRAVQTFLDDLVAEHAAADLSS